MNLLLLEPDQLRRGGIATTEDPRHLRHLRDVLRTKVGDTVRVGVRDGNRGTARVLSLEDDGCRLHCTLDHAPIPRSDDTLLLAVPRPKVLGRVLEHATALGFGRLVLFRSWHVDKSHLRSAALGQPALQARLTAGLEQSCRTFAPNIERFDLFKPFVEDRLDEVVPATARRFVAHFRDAPTTAEPLQNLGPFAVAIGPERGFTEYEVDMLRSRNFAPRALNAGILRVEAAVVAAHAQLAERSGSLHTR